MPRFLELVERFNCKIVEETPVEDGITRIKYQLPAKDMTGENILGEYKSTPHFKTVYDPEIISDEAFMNRGFEAFENALSKYSDMPHQWSAPDNSSLEWTGFINSAGEPTNFFLAD